ncbi:aminotransferase class III-fold pyridoxal phosphate-dependent enzyme [Candidatus Poribacteria bacterium]|nr:aminotransferase class III-fold pyridoxal phosphate-dependent enzyme [Candidatus Poribacteria bacterium]
MAHRDLFGLVLNNRENFPLNFVNYHENKDNIRKIQDGRKLLIEKQDVPLLESYRKNVGVVHQCQMPWIFGFGVNGGRLHRLPDGRTLWQFINEEVGPPDVESEEWFDKCIKSVLEMIPEYIDTGCAMKMIAKQGDLINLCGGVMVSRVGYNPVHSLLLMLTGLGYSGNTYNSAGVDTGRFAEMAKKIYMPRGKDGNYLDNLDDHVIMFRNTGGEATFLAMQVAKEVTGKKERIGYAGSYHGRFEYVDVKYFEHVINFPDRLTGISEDESIQQLEDILKKSGDRIGALIMEGVQGGSCYLPGNLQDGRPFYEAVRELCDSYGIIFVMDLVQVNGITGSWNPVEEADSSEGAHIYALGKGYSEAYPLSGVLMPCDYANRLEIGGWTSTHSMHWQGPTVSMGLFLINDYMKEKFGKDLMEYSRPNGEYFNSMLGDIAQKYDDKNGVTIQHQGMEHGFMHSIRFSSMTMADRFVEKLTEVGCYVFDTIKRADYSTVKLFPPLLSAKMGLDEALFCIDYALSESGSE